MRTQWDRRPVQAPQAWTQVKPALGFGSSVVFVTNTSKILIDYINIFNMQASEKCLIKLLFPLQGMGPALQSLVRRDDAFRWFLWLFHPINSTKPAQDS